MAYAAVASLSQTIHLILNYHQDSISPQLRIPITSVHQNVIFLQSFLENYPDEADNWEERMRDVTNEAEDIIETIVSNLLLDSTVGSSEPKSKKGKYEFRSNLNELERIAEEIDSIAKGVKERHRQTAGGFDNDLTEIVDRLWGGSRCRETIAIVGRGGIGKTTLARNAYNHPLIVEHFDIRAWVTVSQDYSRVGGVLLFLLNILRAGGQRNTSYSEHDGIELIVKFLFFRKYLIVLDDVGSKEAWNMLHPAFPDNGNGSRIILTTRLPEVASSCCHIHEMRSMNVDESWDLLRQKIFKGKPCPPKLEHIGKKIGRSCRGLPLAIEVVAGILTADLTKAQWEDIAENMETVIDGEDDEHPLQILSLSYTYMPHHLRPCLLYLGIFPKVHEVRVSKLIKLWVAEGFLNESECKSSEETGEEYLEELVKRSLVSVIKRRNSDGRVKRVSIHDLVWDFCARQAKLDNFFIYFTESPVAAGAIQLQRRVTIADIDNILKSVYGSTIRTIICLNGNREGIPCSLQYFKLLRIVDLSEAGGLFFFTWDIFNKQIFEQFHLRYLAFTVCGGGLINIQKAISKLENLQTLIILPMPQEPRKLVELPVEIWRMRQLRHVVVHSCVLPTQEEEEEMSALENLQTLGEAVNFVCSRDNLEMIPNLKKLCILYTDLSHPEDYQLCNLIYFQKLEVLKIRTREGYGISLAFPPTLKRLSLNGLELPWEDMKIVGLLPHLQVLELRDEACIGSKWETSEGGFSQLNFLLIHNSDLEHWITATTHFPVLNCLVLLGCRNLREVPNDIGHIPTLGLIEVDELNTFLLGSAKSIQEDQQSSRNHSLQVHAVPIPFKRRR